MLFQVGIPLIVILITGLILNPYMSHKPRDMLERWTTRERSFGHPYYWRMRYCAGKQFNDDYPLHLSWLNNERFKWCSAYSNDCGDNYFDHHTDVHNKLARGRGFTKNIMYIES